MTTELSDEQLGRQIRELMESRRAAAVESKAVNKLLRPCGALAIVHDDSETHRSGLGFVSLTAHYPDLPAGESLWKSVPAILREQARKLLDGACAVEAKCPTQS